MKLRKVLSLMLVCLSVTGWLCACTADDINGAIEDAASAAGVEVDVNITQEQIDGAIEAGKGAADKVKNVITDENVQNAAKGFLDSVKDAAKNSKETE